MNDLLTYLIPILKFTALFISAFSGSMALLVDFKKDGKITKWGKMILVTITISFLISVSMQTIEMYRAKEAALAERLKTEKILAEISRGVYAFDAGKICFNLQMVIPTKYSLYQNYLKRLRKAFIYFNANPNARVPKGVSKLFYTDTKGRHFNGFSISPNSVLYPNRLKEKRVFDIIGNIAMDIKFFKFNSDSNRLTKYPALNFRTEGVMPILDWRVEDDKIGLNANSIKIDLQDLSWRNDGSIQSLTDLSKAKIEFCYSDSYMNDFDSDQMNAIKILKTERFSLTVLNRLFVCSQPCVSNNEYPISYFSLPDNPFKTYLQISCE